MVSRRWTSVAAFVILGAAFLFVGLRVGLETERSITVFEPQAPLVLLDGPTKDPLDHSADSVSETRFANSTAEETSSLGTRAQREQALAHGGSVQKPWQQTSVAEAEAASTPLEDAARRVVAWALDHPDLFAMRDLPCARSYRDAEREPRIGIQRALFIRGAGTGSGEMRGNHLAAGLNSLPGWEAVPIDPSEFDRAMGELKGNVSLCVFVKSLSVRKAEQCHQRGAVVFYDVVDKLRAIHEYLNGAGAPPHADLTITPTANVANMIEKNSNLSERLHGGHSVTHPLALVLYHQHSNPGIITPLASILRPGICRVAQLVGSTHNAQTGFFKQTVSAGLCLSGAVDRFSIMHQEWSAKRHGTVYSWDINCSHLDRVFSERMDRPDLKAFYKMWKERPPAPLGGGKMCSHLGSLGVATNYEPSQAAIQHNNTCFAKQWKYHDDPEMATVDLAIQWPHGSGVSHVNTSKRHNRPTTRALYWMSHGVPIIFGPDVGYRELAVEGDYRLPTGEYPFAGQALDLPALVAKLADPWARLRLRERGFAIAARWSTLGTAKRLAELVEQKQTPSKTDIAQQLIAS